MKETSQQKLELTVSKFDMTLFISSLPMIIIKNDDGKESNLYQFYIQFEYNIDLFKRNTIEKIADNFILLMNFIINVIIQIIKQVK